MVECIKKLRVLVTDDQIAILDVIRNLLTSEFEIIGCATDGAEALAKHDALRPDVMVLDVSMPGISGLEVAKRLRQAECMTPIVFLSVDQSQTAVDAAFSVGGTCYVSKARAVSDLAKAIRYSIVGGGFVALDRHS